MPIDLLSKYCDLIAEAQRRDRVKLTTVQMNEIKNELMEEWQPRWDITEKGRVTNEIMPSVTDRMTMNWIKINHYNVQLMSGQGNFKAKLHGFQLVLSPLCEVCGVDDSLDRVLNYCVKIEDLRDALQEDLVQHIGNHPEMANVVMDLKAIMANKELHKKWNTLQPV